MNIPQIIDFDDMDHRLNWSSMMAAIQAGHRLAPAQIKDTVLRHGHDSLLNRLAWINGLGIMVKTATVFPKTTPSIGGGVMLFDSQQGKLRAIIYFNLVTKWKTIADSLLAAQHLARPDSKRLLCVGAGVVVSHAIDGYRSLFKDLDISIWNRNQNRAEALAKAKGADVVGDLAIAVAQADIICCATMSVVPIIKGDWLRSGTHLVLIGAYRADMREVDDATLTRARIFVDSYDSTLDHIGELCDPLRRGIIKRHDVIADYYALHKFKRQSSTEITLFKNGGGAHLDLMIANAILTQAAP